MNTLRGSLRGQYRKCVKEVAADGEDRVIGSGDGLREGWREAGIITIMEIKYVPMCILLLTR